MIAIHLDVGRGGCMAHAMGPWVGANCTARNRERALAKIRREVRAYAAWLRTRGERVSARGPLRVVEVVTGMDPWVAGGVNALFGPDRAPATRADVARCVRRMAWNREETLAIAARVPRRAWRRTWTGEPRTIADTLAHIANAEIWYLTRIGVEAADLPADPLERLAAARGAVVRSLGGLTVEQRKRVFVPTRYCSPRQRRLREAWTARKVLRRLLEHERQHARYMRRLLET